MTDRYFVSIYTDGPATRWNVIDRHTQEWVRRFASEQEAKEYASQMEQRGRPKVTGPRPWEIEGISRRTWYRRRTRRQPAASPCRPSPAPEPRN